MLEKHVWRSSGIIKIRWIHASSVISTKAIILVGKYIQGKYEKMPKIWRYGQRDYCKKGCLGPDQWSWPWYMMCSRNKQTDLITIYEWGQITIHFFQTKHSRPCIIRHLQIMYNSYLLSAIINYPLLVITLFCAGRFLDFDLDRKYHNTVCKSNDSLKSNCCWKLSFLAWFWLLF